MVNSTTTMVPAIMFSAMFFHTTAQSSLFELQENFGLRYLDYVGCVLKCRDGYKRANHEKKPEEVAAVMKFPRCGQ